MSATAGRKTMITDRMDAITLVPDARQRPDPPSPRNVKIELSQHCNDRCGSCALRMRGQQPSPIESLR